MDITSSCNRKKFIWFWLSNSNPWNDNEPKEWKRYSDFENEFIEDAFQQQEREVQLNDHTINFEYLMAFKKEDKNTHIQVKREEVRFHKYVRQERFAHPERALKAFDSKYEQEYNFVWQWRKKNEHIASSGRYNYPAIADAAAQGKSDCKLLYNIQRCCSLFYCTGILDEGRALNKEFDAQKMAEKLRTAKSEEEICRCAARLYSAESFLYRLINLSLADHDMSKIDTLGPFCHLLWRHLYSNNNSHEQVLYRAATLTDEMIDEYKHAVGRRISWPAFTSTTKDREVAKFYSRNTLFIISMEDAKKERSDISSLSYYSDEQEVLLPQHSDFQIEKVEHHADNDQYTIHMKAVS